MNGRFLDAFGVDLTSSLKRQKQLPAALLEYGKKFVGLGNKTNLWKQYAKKI